MKRGPWHQCGDRSQKLVLEQLQHKSGVGVIISPRDLAYANAQSYAAKYQQAKADVLYDPQFYVPSSMLGKLDTHPLSEHRQTVSDLCTISDMALQQLAASVATTSKELRVSAVIAPAVVYEAGRADIELLNERLFSAGREAAGSLGVPVYATVVLGRSITGVDHLTEDAVSTATALDADGWYFAYEFLADRVPFAPGDISRYARTLLRLAMTGKPVLNAYAGPAGLLAPGFGATGVGIGHSQNTWQFTRDRWTTVPVGGGGGDAPARYFSTSLWGTIVHPDETKQLTASLRSQILTPSPFTSPWNRWQANKHLVYTMCTGITPLCKHAKARDAAKAAAKALLGAVKLHKAIENEHVKLRDNTASYQRPWAEAIAEVLKQASSDYDYLELLGS